MEVGSIIQFDNKDYTIKKILYKSRGSKNQILTQEKNEKTENRRTFYLVERNGIKCWVKEYTDSDYGYGIEYEFNETRRLLLPSLMGLHEISTVHVFTIEKNKILMEYLEDYHKFNPMVLNHIQRLLIKGLIEKWIKEHDVHDYDMCNNNTMIKISKKNISIKLLDFEYSIGVDQLRWRQFVTSI